VSDDLRVEFDETPLIPPRRDYVVFEEFGQPLDGPRRRIMDAFGLTAEERELVGVLHERERPAREAAERARVGVLARIREHAARLEREILEQLR
jgi:hypothetical protein